MNDTMQRLYDRYGKETVDSLFSYPQEQFVSEADVIMQLTIDDVVVDGKRVEAVPQEDPHIYLVGGQPGCGKSGGMKRAINQEKEHGYALTISMDCYRDRHPNIKRIKEVIFTRCTELGLSSSDMSADLVAFTNAFADDVEAYIVPRLFDQGYNLVMESTLKNGKKNVDKMRGWRERNPQCQVSVIMVGVSQELAYQGAMSRAEQMNICMTRLVAEMQRRGITDIYPVTRGPVDKAYYDGICDKLPGSMQEFASPENADVFNGNVTIVDRTGKVEYDRNNADPLNNNPAEIQESCLRGRIGQRQLEDEAKRDDGTVKFYGVEAFISENKTTITQVFGSEEVAREAFQEAVMDTTAGPKM